MSVMWAFHDHEDLIFGEDFCQLFDEKSSRKKSLRDLGERAVICR